MKKLLRAVSTYYNTNSPLASGEFVKTPRYYLAKIIPNV